MVSRRMDDLGQKFGKYDLERVGLFWEMPYMIDDPYVNRKITNDIRDLKKSQMYSGILKTKTGLQDAYFDKEFKRLYESEKWKPPTSIFRANDNNKQKGTRPFIPPGYTERHSTPGDYFGTFGPKLPAMSVKKKKSPKREKVLPNISIKATNTRGPGYTDLGFSPFPEYKSTPYNDPINLKNVQNNKKRIEPFRVGGYSEFFDKNPYFSKNVIPTYKKIFKQSFKNITPFKPTSTINQIGKGFDTWPTHLPDKYIDPHRIGYKNQRNKLENIRTFYPQSKYKSFYTTSTMQRKLRSAMNNLNWKTFEPIHTSKQIQK